MLLKRCIAEIIGTFFVVFGPVALSATGKLPGGDGSLLGSALISGLAVLAMIAAFGGISAAHFNPAVTIAFAVARRFPAGWILPYIAAQVTGAILAAGAVFIMFGPGFGVHIPAEPALFGRNFLTEGLISFFLMLVIMAVATEKGVDGTLPALAIGFVVVAGVLLAGPVTGGSMNPVRSLGPAVFAGGEALANIALYLSAPVLGAMLAALTYEAIRFDRTGKNAPA